MLRDFYEQSKHQLSSGVANARLRCYSPRSTAPHWKELDSMKIIRHGATLTTNTWSMQHDYHQIAISHVTKEIKNTSVSELANRCRKEVGMAKGLVTRTLMWGEMWNFLREATDLNHPTKSPKNLQTNTRYHHCLFNRHTRSLSIPLNCHRVGKTTLNRFERDSLFSTSALPGLAVSVFSYG